MNKKLIAAAVSAVVIAPVAQAQDTDHTHHNYTVNGNITNAIVLEDEGGGADSTTDISTVGSRLGVLASSDFGNGMQANGTFEWALPSDDAGQAFSTTRIATVGLSGAFGSVNVGRQWSSFFNNVGTLVSPNYTVAVPHGSPGFTSNTIQYRNSFGPVDLGVDVRLDDERDGEGDGFGIGLTFRPISNLTIGLAYDDEDGSEGAPVTAAVVATPVTAGTPVLQAIQDGADIERFGIAGRLSFSNNFWVSAGYQTRNDSEADAIDYLELGTTVADRLVFTPGDDIPGVNARGEEETTYYQLWGGTTVGETTTLALGFGNSTAEMEGRAVDTEIDQWAFKVNHHMGGGFRLFLEHEDTSREDDEDGKTDSNKTLLGIRINF